MIMLLVKAQAKLTCLDKDGRTPLHYAAEGGHRDGLAELLKSGSQVCNSL
jgi:ankyrin repeat protein